MSLLRPQIPSRTCHTSPLFRTAALSLQQGLAYVMLQTIWMLWWQCSVKFCEMKYLFCQYFSSSSLFAASAAISAPLSSRSSSWVRPPTADESFPFPVVSSKHWSQAWTSSEPILLFQAGWSPIFWLDRALLQEEICLLVLSAIDYRFILYREWLCAWWWESAEIRGWKVVLFIFSEAFCWWVIWVRDCSTLKQEGSWLIALLLPVRWESRPRMVFFDCTFRRGCTQKPIYLWMVGYLRFVGVRLVPILLRRHVVRRTNTGGCQIDLLI